MSIKWTKDQPSMGSGHSYSGLGIKTYAVGGAGNEWWAIMDRTLHGVRLSLGWSPTLTMAKRQCQILDDYYAKKQEQP